MKALMRIAVILGMMLVLGLGPAGAAMAADLRGGNDISIGPGEIIEDDLYVGAGNVSIQGRVTGDVIATGGNVTIDGTIDGALMVAGGTMVLNGHVGRSARLAGGSLTVNGSITEDLLFAGGQLVVGPGASIGRDLVVGNGTTELRGTVLRNLQGGAGHLSIAGTVGRDVRVQTDALSLAPGARIGGDLVYTSANPATIAPEATLGGQVQQLAPAPGPRGPTLTETLAGKMRDLVGSILLGLAFFWLLPWLIPAASSTIRRSPLASLGIGAAAMVLVPLVALVLTLVFFFTGGWSVLLTLVAVAGVATLLSEVVVGYLLGWLLLEHWTNRERMAPFVQALVALTIGILILVAISFIPVLNVIAGVLTIVVAVGAGVLAFIRWRRGVHQAPMPAA